MPRAYSADAGKSTQRLAYRQSAAYHPADVRAYPPRPRPRPDAARKIRLCVGALQPLAGLDRREPPLGARAFGREVLGAVLFRIWPRVDRGPRPRDRLFRAHLGAGRDPPRG